MVRLGGWVVASLAVIGCADPVDDIPLNYDACDEVTPSFDAIEHPDTGRFNALFIEALRASPYSEAAQFELGQMIGANGDLRYCVHLSVRVDWFAITQFACFDHDDDDAMTQAFTEHLAGWPELPAAILPLDEVEALAEGCFPGIVEPDEPCGNRPTFSYLVGYSMASAKQPADSCFYSSDSATVDLVRGELIECGTAISGGCEDG